MKANELREKDIKALQTELLDLTRERFNLRMQAGSGQLARPHRLRDVSRDIARVKTIMNEIANKAKKTKIDGKA